VCSAATSYKSKKEADSEKSGCLMVVTYMSEWYTEDQSFEEKDSLF
jgi:hypothetical protein